MLEIMLESIIDIEFRGEEDGLIMEIEEEGCY